MKPKLEQDYLNIAKQFNLVWLGPLPSNVLGHTNWKCSNGHVWLATFCGIQRGDGCPKCSNEKLSLNSNDYINFGKKFKINWLDSSPPKNTKTKTYWGCTFCSHEFFASISNIRSRKNGCPKCKTCKHDATQRQNSRKTIDDYIEIGKSNSINWIGKKKPPNINTKTYWKCKEGHIWQTTYKLISKGRGCPYCNNSAQKAEKDYHDLARSLNVKWIGESTPQYVRSKTKWQCEKGHVWEASFNNSMKMRSCPNCQDFISGVKVSSQQRMISNMVGGVINFPVGKFRIDIKVPNKNKKIAIEYDCLFWHSPETVASECDRDKFLLEKGWNVLHIKSWRQIPSEECLNNALADLDKYKILHLNLGDIY